MTFNAYLCGGQVGDDGKQNAAGDCIKIVEHGGKLYTGTPSVSFLQAINYDGHNLEYNETGLYGPIGAFARFNYSEAVDLCDQYNTIELYANSDWHLAKRSELESLYNDLGQMFKAKGWATSPYYWSSTPTGSYHYFVNLIHGYVGSSNPSSQLYVSCVSGF